MGFDTRASQAQAAEQAQAADQARALNAALLEAGGVGLAALAASAAPMLLDAKSQEPHPIWGRRRSGVPSTRNWQNHLVQRWPSFFR